MSNLLEIKFWIYVKICCADFILHFSLYIFHYIVFVWAHPWETRTKQKRYKKKTEVNQKSLDIPCWHVDRITYWNSVSGFIKTELPKLSDLDLNPPEPSPVLLLIRTRHSVTQGSPISLISRKYFYGGGGH